MENIQLRHCLALAFKEDSPGPVLFETDSPELLDLDGLVDRIYAALAPMGIKRPKESDDFPLYWEMEVHQVHFFRGNEFLLPYQDDEDASVENVAEALEKVDSHEVLVVISRKCHVGGGWYGSRLLAVPRGETMLGSPQCCGDAELNRELNHVYSVDANAPSEVVLPPKTKYWDGTQWVPIEKLTYDY